MISENDIRPDELVKKQREVFEADLQWLRERQKNFISVLCPACSSGEDEFVFLKKGIRYVRCRQCQTVFVNPRPESSLLAEYYRRAENYPFWNKFIFPASEEARREKIFKPRAARLSTICQRYDVQGVLLEVGAGFGTFCEAVRDEGVFEKILAVEPTAALAETCRQRGFEVIEKPIEEVNLPKSSIDVIASFEVIEHLYDPLSFLQSCFSLLRDEGLLILTCPNINGFDISVLGPVSDAVDHEHLNYFHPQSLSFLLERGGFCVLEVSTPGELDAELVRKKALVGEFDLQAYPFLKTVLMDRWDELGAPFQKFLKQYNLSSHMWIVAMK